MKRFLTTGIVVCLQLAVIQQVPAATVAWSGAGANNNWATDENWAGDTAPATTDDTEFGATAGHTTVSITGGNKQANSVNFIAGAPSYSFTGGNFLLLKEVTVAAGVTAAQSMGSPLRVIGTMDVTHNGSEMLNLDLLRDVSSGTSSSVVTIAGTGSGALGSYLSNSRATQLAFDSTGAWSMNGTFDFVINDLAVDSIISINDGTFDVSSLTMNFATVGALGESSYLVLDYSGGGNVVLNGSSIFGSVVNLPTGYQLQNDVLNSQISLVAVPEPGIGALFGFGLGAFVFAQRTKRRHSGLV